MQSLYSGLVSYWNLQDASGARADLVGGVSLTNTNTVTSTDGIIGNASNFASASSQRLEVASSASVQITSTMTFAFWAQITTKPANRMVMLSKYSATAGQAEYQIGWDNTDDAFYMIFYRSTNLAVTVLSTFGAPSTGVWYFICGWVDLTNQDVYISVNNGEPDTAHANTAIQAASSAAFAMGSLGATATLYLNGKMCEVGRWNRHLTAQERRWLYNNGRGRTYPFTGRYAIGLSRHGRSRRMQGIG